LAATRLDRRLDDLRIRSVKHLCLLMGTDPRELDSICAGIDINPVKFYRFRTVHRNGKSRALATPVGRLRDILSRLNRHLQRFEFPDYMHGGLRGRSTKTYALPHVRRKSVLKSDLKDFFPSIRPGRVYDTFLKLGCTPDVAHYITRLTTVNGQLPQGSPTSTVVAALVSIGMAVRLRGLADFVDGHSGTFVDDLALSGPPWVGRFRSTVRRIIRQERLTPNDLKTVVVKSSEEQVIAGVRVNHGLDAPKTKVHEVRALIEQLHLDVADGKSPDLSVLRSIRGKIQHVDSLNRGAAHSLTRRLARALEGDSAEINHTVSGNSSGIRRQPSLQRH